VRKNISSSIHYHDNSVALLTILGVQENHPDPREAFCVYRDTTPFPAKRGISMLVDEGCIHGFFILSKKAVGGTVSFLSVQSPRIEEDLYTLEGVQTH
jgi:hypothetical protein